MANAKKKKLPPWLDKNKNGVVDSKEKGKGKGKGKESKSEDKTDKGKSKEGKKDNMVEAMRKLPFEHYKKGK